MNETITFHLENKPLITGNYSYRLIPAYYHYDYDFGHMHMNVHRLYSRIHTNYIIYDFRVKEIDYD